MSTILNIVIANRIRDIWARWFPDGLSRRTTIWLWAILAGVPAVMAVIMFTIEWAS